MWYLIGVASAFTCLVIDKIVEKEKWSIRELLSAMLMSLFSWALTVLAIVYTIRDRRND